MTATYNEGLCAPCKQAQDYALRQRKLAEARNSAPFPPIPYDRFTRRQFVSALSAICLPLAGNPAEVSLEFLGFCDPIIHRNSKLGLLGSLFHRRQLYRNLRRVPRPYRELLAVYHARGMVASDGFDSYVMSTTKKFDNGVERGLRLLGQETASGVLGEARLALQDGRAENSDETESDFWKRFYESTENFEESILADALLDQLRAEQDADDQPARARSKAE